MADRLRILGGKAAVFNDENQAAFTDPLNNLGDVYFHSDLDYLTIVEERTVSISLPARSSTESRPWWQGGNQATTDFGYVEHALFTHSKTPLFVIGRVGKSAATGATFTYATSTSFRVLNVFRDGSAVKVSETYRATGAGLPAESLTITVYLIDTADPIPNEPAMRMSAQTGIVTMGFGKISSENLYLREAKTVPEDFFLYNNGQSIDLLSAGMRYIDGDGVAQDYSGYAGAFVSPIRTGVVV